MGKKYYKVGTFYKVYHYPTTQEYYFDWKPNKKDILKLCEVYDIDILDENEEIPSKLFTPYLFTIEKVTTEDPSSYDIKLRSKHL